MKTPIKQFGLIFIPISLSSVLSKQHQITLHLPLAVLGDKPLEYIISFCVCDDPFVIIFKTRTQELFG